MKICTYKLNLFLECTDYIYRIIENAGRQLKMNAAEIFLTEWSTMGRSRPSLGILLDLLTKEKLFRAADYLAKEILNSECLLFIQLRYY